MSNFSLPLLELEPTRKEWLAARNRMLSQSESDPKKQALKDILNNAAGTAVIIADLEYDIDAILDRAVFILGTQITQVEGSDNRCHMNSALFWFSNSDSCQIMTGYALSEDGIWRQHSWCILNENPAHIIETTINRLLYYGFALDPDESDKFFAGNVLEL